MVSGDENDAQIANVPTFYAFAPYQMPNSDGSFTRLGYVKGTSLKDPRLNEGTTLFKALKDFPTGVIEGRTNFRASHRMPLASLLSAELVDSTEDIIDLDDVQLSAAQKKMIKDAMTESDLLIAQGKHKDKSDPENSLWVGLWDGLPRQKQPDDAQDDRWNPRPATDGGHISVVTSSWHPPPDAAPRHMDQEDWHDDHPQNRPQVCTL